MIGKGVGKFGDRIDVVQGCRRQLGGGFGGLKIPAPHVVFI